MKSRWKGTAALSRVGIACALFGALLLPVGAAAQNDTARDEEARKLFESATVAFKAGRHEVALERFREALELSGRPALYYNIGIAADRLRRNEEALEAFRMYLEKVPEAPDRADVEARIRVLERTVAREKERAEAEAARETSTDTNAETDATVPTPEEAAEAAAAEEEATEIAATHAPAAGETEAKPVTSRWWFWTAIGAAVVGAVGLGVGLSLSNKGVQDPLPGSNGASYQTLREAP